MADDKLANGHSGGRRSGKIRLTMEDLEALDSFAIQGPAAVRGQVIGAEETEGGFTCNVKCGPTAYWECSTTPEWGCMQTDQTCYPVCSTAHAVGDPYCATWYQGCWATQDQTACATC